MKRFRAFSTNCRDHIRKTWVRFAAECIPIPLLQDLSDADGIFCKQQFLKLAMHYFTTGEWADGSLDFIDRNDIWSIFIDNDEVSICQMMQNHKNMALRDETARIAAMSQEVREQHQYVVHMGTKMLRRADFECVFLQAGGDEDVRVCWTDEPVPDFTAAYVSNGADRHEYHYIGHMDVAAELVLERFWSDVLIPVPHKVTHVSTTPTDPGAIYMEVEMDVPWFFKIIARPATLKIFRVVRVTNTIFSSAIDYSPDTWDRETKRPHVPAFDPKVCGLCQAVSVTDLTKGCLYKRVDLHVNSWVPRMMTKWTNSWMVSRWSHRLFASAQALAGNEYHPFLSLGAEYGGNNSECMFTTVDRQMGNTSNSFLTFN